MLPPACARTALIGNASVSITVAIGHGFINVGFRRSLDLRKCAPGECNCWSGHGCRISARMGTSYCSASEKASVRPVPTWRISVPSNLVDRAIPESWLLSWSAETPPMGFKGRSGIFKRGGGAATAFTGTAARIEPQRHSH
jgi:hypothetical protein